MGIKIQTIRDIRSIMSEELRNIYPEPEIGALATLIIKTLKGFKKLQLVYDQNMAVQKDEADRILKIIYELKSGKPVQYIIGSAEFYNCTLKVTPATLIPRQETEELVALIIKENHSYTGTIVDFGTGSGCIAIALAKNIPGSEVIATDISSEALSVAADNAELNNVSVEFIQEDIFSGKTKISAKPGIIVSNPPYVKSSEKVSMNKNVLDYEPHNALFVSDSDPLIYYRAILQLADKIISEGGRIYFEINEALGMEMLNLMKGSGYKDAVLVKDLNGKDRIIKGTRNG